MVLELVDVQDGEQPQSSYQKAEIFKIKGNEQVKIKNYP